MDRNSFRFLVISIFAVIAIVFLGHPLPAQASISCSLSLTSVQGVSPVTVHAYQSSTGSAPFGASIFYVNWGDGSLTDDGGELTTGTGVWQQNFTHGYSSNGTYSAHLTSSLGCSFYLPITVGPVTGCMDSLADNYNSAATVAGSCTYTKVCVNSNVITGVTTSRTPPGSGYRDSIGVANVQACHFGAVPDTYTATGDNLSPSYTGPTYNTNPQTLTAGNTITFNLTYTASGGGGTLTNGVCAATHYNCSAGTSSGTTGDTSTLYKWDCNGSGVGHTNAPCSEANTGGGTPLPDLIAGAITPTTAVVNISVDLTATISNIGNASSGTSFQNLFRVRDSAGTITDHTNTITAMSPTLAAGANSTVTKSHPFSAVGTYSVRACADKSSSTDGGDIPESDENNNCGPWTDVVVTSTPVAVACTPATQSVQTGASAGLSASGGNGTFSWTATGGSPASGALSSFSTSYASTGTKTVTVTSNGQSASCLVEVTQGDRVPIGNLDRADCTMIAGWAYDPDTPSDPIVVHMYKENPDTQNGIPLVWVDAMYTTRYIHEVNIALGLPDDPSQEISKHGFGWFAPLPDVFLDGGTHTAYVFGINDTSPVGANSLIGQGTVSGCYQSAPTATLIANPTAVEYGGASNLSWESKETVANSCSIPGLVSGGATSGSVSTGSLTATTNDYTVTCQGLNGSPVTATATVSIPPPPTNLILSCPSPGTTVTASWIYPSGYNTAYVRANNIALHPLDYDAWPSDIIQDNVIGTSSNFSSIAGQTYHVWVHTRALDGSRSIWSDRIAGNVTCLAPAPTVSSVIYTTPDYCSAGLEGTFDWNYTDLTSPQSAYQVQVSTTNNFSNPAVYDSCDNIFYINTCNNGGSSTSSAIPTGVLALSTRYYARVKVWNSYNVASNWVEMSSCVDGTGGNSPCNSNGNGRNWKTPQFYYPQANFTWTANGIFENPRPPLNRPITFTDTTNFRTPGGNNNVDWDFGDNTSDNNNNAESSVNHTYNSIGSYDVKLTARDNANQQCEAHHTMNVIKPIPVIKEVAPR